MAVVYWASKKFTSKTLDYKDIDEALDAGYVLKTEVSPIWGRCAEGRRGEIKLEAFLRVSEVDTKAACEFLKKRGWKLCEVAKAN